MNDQKHFPMADAVRAAYAQGQEDEAMEPIVLEETSGAPVGRINEGDYVIFYDIRGEREIQLTECFVDPGFSHFPIDGLQAHFATMIQYDPKLNVRVAFPPQEKLKNTLCEVVTKAGLKVTKVVETEKAVHLSFFLNGKNREAFSGENRNYIPSPKVDDYSQHPKMQVEKVAAAVVKEIADKENALIIANFANTDVIGHVENREAVIQAIEAVDQSVGKVVQAAREAGMDVLITADHGSAERWYYPDGAIDTGHTDSPVPFIHIESGAKKNAATNKNLEIRGSLADVAPTAINLMGLEVPSEMTGKPLHRVCLRGSGDFNRVFLLIADGWGYNSNSEGNLIAEANTPNMDSLIKAYPTVLLHASGEAVGMPKGTVGNSEAGHLHIGAGRTVYSDRLRIDRSLGDKSFFENPAFVWAMDGAVKNGKNLHLLGIISFYSSHGSLDHLMALMRMAQARRVPNVFIHGLLGRRGERPEAGAAYMEDVEKEGERLGVGQAVTVIGRHWALDREHNWDRIEKTYRALVQG
ncbi:MAG: alkaline phosphatase family protein, partial [Planctomycetota bacterium]